MFKDVNSVDAGGLLIVDLNSFHFRVTKIFNLESLVDKNLYQEMSKSSKSQLSEKFSDILSESIVNIK